MRNDVQEMELDLIAGLEVPPDEVGPEDFMGWDLRGGCTMPRDQHRAHIKMLLGLGQRP